MNFFASKQRVSNKNAVSFWVCKMGKLPFRQLPRISLFFFLTAVYDPDPETYQEQGKQASRNIQILPLAQKER